MSLLVVLARQSARQARRGDTPPLVIERVEPSPRRRARKQQRRLAEAEVDELVTARLQGTEINDLAHRFGIHRATVLSHLHRRAVPRQRWSGRTLPGEALHEAGKLYESGLPLLAVAERFDVDTRYLSRVLPAAGYTVRPPGQQPR